MSKGIMSQDELSRRTVLRRSAILSASLGLGAVATTGQAAAMNKAELIEAMASHAGLSKSDAKRALDAFTSATTNALQKGDSAVLIGFGSFSISKRSARTGRNPRSRNGPADESPVTFDACPEFAAALDLNPGKGDEASARCRDADVVIDAEYIAIETGRESREGVSASDAERAIGAFVSVATEALKKGDRLSVDGGADESEVFGTFSISKRSARTGRNPQTGKEIQIAAKNVVEFKTGAELSKAVN
ncbi:HU family DNA-binding protein [Halorubrum sp. Eb13]|uniref:HU family DNA-binding protein n=1 Tax=Halorubrum sp. Eb13 TaxID=1383843 RepID=UPI0023BA19D7|nr:HU family DNA-binding protein [Halorubrum sp. Eb13]